MAIVSQVVSGMQTVLTTVSDRIAKTTAKIDGFKFCSNASFWLAGQSELNL